MRAVFAVRGDLAARMGGAPAQAGEEVAVDRLDLGVRRADVEAAQIVGAREPADRRRRGLDARTSSASRLSVSALVLVSRIARSFAVLCVAPSRTSHRREEQQQLLELVGPQAARAQ